MRVSMYHRFKRLLSIVLAAALLSTQQGVSFALTVVPQAVSAPVQGPGAAAGVNLFLPSQGLMGSPGMGAGVNLSVSPAGTGLSLPMGLPPHAGLPGADVLKPQVSISVSQTLSPVRTAPLTGTLSPQVPASPAEAAAVPRTAPALRTLPAVFRVAPRSGAAPAALGAAAEEREESPGKSSRSPLGSLSALSRGIDPAVGLKGALLQRYFDGSANHPGSPLARSADPAADPSGRPRPRIRLQRYQEGTDEVRRRIKELKGILGDGTRIGERWITPFVFHLPGSHRRARSAGLEGFLYTKLEVEREHGEEASARQLEYYFRYLDELLSPVGWTGELRAELAAVRGAGGAPAAVNRRLNDWLKGTVKGLQDELRTTDPSRWGRNAHTYMILARAYNRLRPGKNFFDSLDDRELRRIKEVIGADQVWLLDIFQIGEIRRWGTGGGSPYAIKGYRRVKPELGGEAAFKRFIQRAHRAGLRVRTDLIPNHVSLDSDLIAQHPEAVLHMLPPQDMSDEDILRDLPKRSDGEKLLPVFYLIKTKNYPGREGVETKVLVHHPVTDYGDVLWRDMAQMDLSRPEARRWYIQESLHLFSEVGVDSVRRDMAYYVLNEYFYPRQLSVLRAEKDWSRGWVKTEMVRMIRELEARRKQQGGSEFLEELTDEVKSARPDAVLEDEAYSLFTSLSRTGSDGVYGKSTHDSSMGQVGLYDPMRQRNAWAIRAALRNNAFRFWQTGGASIINFIGNHDEHNPADVFGRHLKAAAVTALLLGPILTYNGQELGTGQRQMLGELPGSEDKDHKAIPFDVPVSIDWSRVHPDNQKLLLRIWSLRRALAPILREGTMEVYEPRGSSGITAWSAGRKDAEGRQRAVLAAANWGDDWQWTQFDLDEPLLGDFGAFKPRPDRNYVLRDRAHLDARGEPLTYVRTGVQLVSEGLIIGLDAGDAHVFEIEEVPLDARVQSPHFGMIQAHPRIPMLPMPAEGRRRAGLSAAELQGRALGPMLPMSADYRTDVSPAARAESPAESSWSKWTRRLTDVSTLLFLGVQLPQIVKNFIAFAAGSAASISILPWMGFSAGIMANMLLLAYFVGKKEYGGARVQAVGVVSSSIVLTQIYFAGFMPLWAFAAAVPFVLGGLALNLLRVLGKIPNKPWRTLRKTAGLIALVAIPLFVTATLLQEMVYWPAAVTAAAGLAVLYLKKTGRMPGWLNRFWNDLGAWTATLLFMFTPVAQIISNLTDPADIAGLALVSVLIGLFGNFFMLPRAVLIKDRIWTVGTFWGATMSGWAVLLTMLIHGAASPFIFWPVTAFMPLFMYFLVRMAKKTNKAPSWAQALRFMIKSKDEGVSRPDHGPSVRKPL